MDVRRDGLGSVGVVGRWLGGVLSLVGVLALGWWLSPVSAVAQGGRGASADGDARVQRVAVIDLGVVGGAVAPDVARALTEMVRTTSLRLPSGRYQVITRENLLALLPPEVSLEECTDAQCEIEFGRMVGADFVVTGEIARFGEVLQIQLRLYRTLDGILVSGESGRARSEEEVPDAVEEVTLALLSPLGAEARGGGVRDRRVVQPSLGGGGSRGVGVLEVFVEGPANALVEVDGEEAGVGGRQLTLSAGRRRVVVSAPGYAVFEREVLVREGEVETLRVPTLEMLPVSLWLSAEVHGAEVWVDNRRVGSTSRLAPERVEVSALSTSLRVVREGYTSAEAALRLQPGGTSSWHVVERASEGVRSLGLVPRTLQEVTSWGGAGTSLGFVEVLLSDGAVGEVWSGGRLVGVTGSQLALSPGTHVLSVQVPGYQAEERSVSLSSGSAERVLVGALRPLPAVLYLGCDVAGAEVVLDGVLLGRTPVGASESRWELAASSRLLEVRREGLGRREFALRLLPGEEVRASCDLGGVGEVLLGSGGGAIGGTEVEGEFVLVRAGTFRMGSPANEEGRESSREAQVDVRLTRDFFLGRYPVTQGQYQALMGGNPSDFRGCGARCPVENVSWFDAVRFTNRLNERQGLPSCYDNEGRVVGGATVYACAGYRLPTEAEWEYAARAGTTGARYGALDAVAWHAGNSGRRTHPVGGKQANAWGFHDMLGNVWEWTATWYRDAHSGGTDPVGPSSGSYRVFRGGSWINVADYARAASRYHWLPHARYFDLGFRLARSAP